MKMCMVRKTTAMMYGLEARIFLHEYDHMEGKDFTDRVSKLKLDIAKKKQKKFNLLKRYIQRTTRRERETTQVWTEFDDMTTVKLISYQQPTENLSKEGIQDALGLVPTVQG